VGHLQQQAKARDLASFTAQLIRRPLDTLTDSARQAISSGEDPSGAMKQILHYAEKVDEAVYDTLDRLFHSEPNPQTISLASFIRKFASDMRTRLAERGHELEVEISPEAEDINLKMDPALVGSALFEFIRNAMQAMSEPGKVSLMAEVVDSGSHVWIAVQDTGPGIGDDVRDFIFNAFYTTREHAVGIGLSKAQQVARDHGGEIGIEDGDELGAIFYIELPLGAGDSAGPAA